jgi:hypothetical protein
MHTKVGKVGRTAALVLLVASASPAGRAFGDEQQPHGPTAPSDRFPSHEFRVAAHQPPGFVVDSSLTEKTFGLAPTDLDVALRAVPQA